MVVSEELLQAIKCQSCGAPSYADLRRQGFYCPFCGTLMPWGETGKPFSLGIRYRHLPVGISEDGCFKLGMSVAREPVKNVFDGDEARLRFPSVDAKLAYCDDKTFEAWQNSETISFICPDCGNQVSGRGTQNILECPSCRNKHVKASVLAGEQYAKDLVIGHDNAYLPNEAIPFKISLDAARQAIFEMINAYPEIFSGRDITGDPEAMQAVYLPYRLCDLFLLAQATTEKGSLLIYHGRVNWALPLSVFHDRFLINALHPWDFGELALFRPELLEGDVRLVGQARNETQAERARMLMRDMPAQIKDAFQVQKAHIDWTQDYPRLHQHAQMMLPIWFLDRKPLSSRNRNDVSARFAVNGQTGKTCCIIDAGTDREYIIERPAAFPPLMSEECTLASPPVPVVAKPGTFQYRPVSFEQALFNKPGLFSRIFGARK